MILTKEQLKTIAPNAGNKIDLYLPYINKLLDEFEINTPLRLQHYLAQILHESGEFKYVEENLNYSAQSLLKTFPKYFTASTVKAYERNPQKIGSRVYANRMGNGNEASGEGYKFRGRGLIQLTGKNNYQLYKGYCGFDVVSKPELIAQPLGAVRSSMWFWKRNGLNALADKDDVVGVTKKINGGTNGLSQRKVYLLRAKLVIK